MGKQNSVTVEGYGTYGDVLKHWFAIEPLIPKGVARRIETKLNFKFVEPWVGGKQRTLSSGCEWSIAGINDFLDKCLKLRAKLNEAKRDGIDAGEFEAWFNQNIIPTTKTGVDDRLTYRQIFEIIETEYFNGRHKFTGEKRSRDSVSCQGSYKTCYTDYFKKCPNWDDYPTWENVQTFWEQFPENQKQFEALGKIKKIISYCPDSVKKQILPKLERIKIDKPRPVNKKAIDWEQFFKWYQAQLLEPEGRQEKHKAGWLWVFKMSVVYGLRPAEVMSAINLYKPISDKEVKTLWGEKGKQYGDSDGINPAFNDKVNNPKMLLILGNGFEVADTSGKKHFITNKTGGRFLYPLCRNREILDFLDLQKIPKLPEYVPEAGSSPKTKAQGLANKLRKKLDDWGCPTTQGYSFRHLGKMLGKLSGLPEGLIADIMGHSLAASEEHYNRKTVGLANELASQATSYPLPYQIAMGELKAKGFNVDDDEINQIIKIIYQLE